MSSALASALQPPAIGNTAFLGTELASLDTNPDESIGGKFSIALLWLMLAKKSTQF
jgi:hypothetical protein